VDFVPETTRETPVPLKFKALNLKNRRHFAATLDLALRQKKSRPGQGRLRGAVAENAWVVGRACFRIVGKRMDRCSPVFGFERRNTFNNCCAMAASRRDEPL
jgi:hypothetical protein